MSLCPHQRLSFIPFSKFPTRSSPRPRISNTRLAYSLHHKSSPLHHSFFLATSSYYLVHRCSTQSQRSRSEGKVSIMTRGAHPSNRGPGGSSRGDKKAGSRRPPPTREVTISKNLSYLLRHNAKDEGIELDEGGWANVADVVGDVYFFSSVNRGIPMIRTGPSLLSRCPFSNYSTSWRHPSILLEAVEIIYRCSATRW